MAPTAQPQSLPPVGTDSATASTAQQPQSLPSADTNLRERNFKQDLARLDAVSAERAFVFCELTAQAAVDEGLTAPKPYWGPVVVALFNAMVDQKVVPAASVQLISCVDAQLDPPVVCVHFDVASRDADDDEPVHLVMKDQQGETIYVEPLTPEDTAEVLGLEDNDVIFATRAPKRKIQSG